MISNDWKSYLCEVHTDRTLAEVLTALPRSPPSLLPSVLRHAAHLCVHGVLHRQPQSLHFHLKNPTSLLCMHPPSAASCSLYCFSPGLPQCKGPVLAVVSSNGMYSFLAISPPRLWQCHPFPAIFTSYLPLTDVFFSFFFFFVFCFANYYNFKGSRAALPLTLPHPRWFSMLHLPNETNTVTVPIMTTLNDWKQWAFFSDLQPQRMVFFTNELGQKGKHFVIHRLPTCCNTLYAYMNAICIYICMYDAEMSNWKK